jgi:hypothetical protein
LCCHPHCVVTPHSCPLPVPTIAIVPAYSQFPIVHVLYCCLLDCLTIKCN